MDFRSLNNFLSFYSFSRNATEPFFTRLSYTQTLTCGPSATVASTSTRGPSWHVLTLLAGAAARDGTPTSFPAPCGLTNMPKLLYSTRAIEWWSRRRLRVTGASSTTSTRGELRRTSRIPRSSALQRARRGSTGSWAHPWRVGARSGDGWGRRRSGACSEFVGRSWRRRRDSLHPGLPSFRARSRRQRRGWRSSWWPQLGSGNSPSTAI